MQSRPPILVVEDDPVLRQVEVVLDPRTSAERIAAYVSYVAHDVPGWHAWRDALRATAADPAAARAYLRKSSMLDALDRAEAIA